MKQVAPTPSVKLDLERYVPALLLRLSNMVSSSASQVYRTRFGVSVTEWRLLAYFKLNPWSTASQACAYMGLDKGAVSRSIAVLTGGGWLDARPKGLRKVEYRLNASGNKLHDEIFQLAMARERALLGGFTPAERDLLLVLMKRMLENAEGLRHLGREPASGKQGRAAVPRSR